MNCVCFYITSVNAIFLSLLFFAILFEREDASPTISNSGLIHGQGTNQEPTSARKAKRDDIRVSEEPKVITLRKKTILSYTYDFTTPNFLVFQAHTQYRNLSLSTFDGTESNTNSDTAILTLGSITNLNEGFHRLEYVLCPPNSTSVQALVTVVLSSQKAPVPGGCCLTCTMEIDPNIVITRKQYYKSVLSFSLANIYDYNNSDCSGQIQFGSKPPDHYRLQYSIYQYFLEEGNLKNDELFDGLSKMLTPAEVKENGKKIRDWNPRTDVPLVVFDTKRGQGMIFNILVFDPQANAESVYSPAVTYGCSFTAKVDGCDSLGSIANIILASCGALFGLFICFFGQRFYRLYIFGSGLTLFSFIGFILLTSETEWGHDVRIIGSVCIGTVGGLMVYLLWWLTGYKYLVLYICGLPFGFLVTAVVFFTPFGNLHYWKNNINYWTVFLCMSVTIPCLFLLCLKMFAIIVSSLVGAYGLVVGIDMFLKSSMTYIILDVIMKATMDDFVEYDVPFQSKDYILSGVWGSLTILGLLVQFWMSKGKPVLPNEVPRKKRKRKKIYRNAQIAQAFNRSPTSNEDDRLPILVNSRNNTTFDRQNDEEQLPILIEPNMHVPRNNEKEQQSTKHGTNVVC